MTRIAGSSCRLRHAHGAHLGNVGYNIVWSRLCTRPLAPERPRLTRTGATSGPACSKGSRGPGQARLWSSCPVAQRDWNSKDGQTVTMTFSERPAPAVVTLPTTETLPGSATRDRPATLCTNELSPEGQSFSPCDGSGGWLRGLSERWPVPFAMSVLPDYDATISFGLPFEPEDSQYGKSWARVIRAMTRLKYAASGRLGFWDSMPKADTFRSALGKLLEAHSRAVIETDAHALTETKVPALAAITAVCDKIVARGNPALVDPGFEGMLLSRTGRRVLRLPRARGRSGPRVSLPEVTAAAQKLR